MKNSKGIALFFLFFMLTGIAYGQVNNSEYKALYGDNAHASAVRVTKQGNSFSFMALRMYVGTLNVMIKETKDQELIQKQIGLVDNLINSSQVSKSIAKSTYKFKDDFRGWIVHSADEGNKGTVNNEVPLFESYAFFYITEFLYLLKESGWIDQSAENRKWWENAVQFVEQNVWTKWRSRSYKESKNYNRIFLRNRTHMGSHWAGVALYLHEISNNADIREQTADVVRQYNTLLKRNLNVQRVGFFSSAYVWNTTYDNVSGTDALGSSSKIVQDVSHGNHVISYVVAAYELGDRNWTKRDIDRFSNTATMIMYDGRTNSFSDNVDGTVDKGRPGLGNNVGDGWVKLGRYNRQVKQVFEKFSQNNVIKRYNQELQFKAVIGTY